MLSPSAFKLLDWSCSVLSIFKRCQVKKHSEASSFEILKNDKRGEEDYKKLALKLSKNRSCWIILPLAQPSICPLTWCGRRGPRSWSGTSHWSVTQRSRSCGDMTVYPPQCWQTSQTERGKKKKRWGGEVQNVNVKVNICTSGGLRTNTCKFISLSVWLKV